MLLKQLEYASHVNYKFVTIGLLITDPTPQPPTSMATVNDAAIS